MSIARWVVYFAFLGDEGTDDGVVRLRLSFMQRQLQWLSRLIGASGDRIEVLVPYVAPRAWDTDVDRVVSRLGFRIDPASVLADRRNTFEYHGFRAMKALAQAVAPSDLIFYCHSKGIVHLEQAKMGIFRFHTEVALTADLHRLTASPDLTRAGLFPYKFGWCWYNFFWIKAGFMAGLVVEESADRHHFEALIGDRSDKEGYRGVLSLIDRLPVESTGLAIQPWYSPAATTTPALIATYDRYAAMAAPTFVVDAGAERSRDGDDELRFAQPLPP